VKDVLHNGELAPGVDELDLPQARFVRLGQNQTRTISQECKTNSKPRAPVLMVVIQLLESKPASQAQDAQESSDEEQGSVDATVTFEEAFTRSGSFWVQFAKAHPREIRW
jgi:hypothetical protein